MYKAKKTQRKINNEKLDALSHRVNRLSALILGLIAPGVKVKLHPGTRALEVAKEGDAGYDLTAREVKNITGSLYLVATGVSVEMNNGVEGQIRPRSSAAKDGFDVQLGTIDSGYRGEISVVMHSFDRAPQVGERVAQLVFNRVLHPNFEVVSELGASARGDTGFGSTGTGIPVPRDTPVFTEGEQDVD